MIASWIDTPEYDEMKEIVVKAFNSLDWEGLTTPSSTAAKKSFKTLAGANECFIYLESYDEKNWYLKGEFNTEGNNILSTHTGTINKLHKESDVNLAVSGFVGIITACINNCRMVRLANK